MTAKAALKNEALVGEVIDEQGNKVEGPAELSFEYDGEKYTFYKSDLDDVEVIEAFEDEKLIRPVRLILGADQWSTFKKKKRSSQDLADMVKEMFSQVGVDAGE